MSGRDLPIDASFGALTLAIVEKSSFETRRMGGGGYLACCTLNTTQLESRAGDMKQNARVKDGDMNSVGSISEEVTGTSRAGSSWTSEFLPHPKPTQLFRVRPVTFLHTFVL